jgi:hypothetical protein
MDDPPRAGVKTTPAIETRLREPPIPSYPKRGAPFFCSSIAQLSDVEKRKNLLLVSLEFPILRNSPGYGLS